jgi:hypothetical protein
MMNSTTARAAGTTEPKKLGLADAASPLPLLVLAFAQIYLLILVATSRSTFAQVMLMTCLESLLVWLLTTLFFSRTWQGFFRRCRELLIMTIVLAMFMITFGVLETTWGAGDDLSNWFEEMRAMVTSNRFLYGLVYTVVLAGGWLLMAWQSGNARPWWAANVAAPASVTFAGMFVACAVGGAMFALFSSFEEKRHFVQVLRSITPIVLFAVYSLTRIFLSWAMLTKFTPDEWRKTEAKFYFDAA